MSRTITRTLFLAGVLALFHCVVHAGPIQFVSQHRYVSVAGSASVLDFSHGELASDSGADGYTAPADDFGPFDAGAVVSSFGVSAYEANASGSGQALQTSSMTDGELRFAGAVETYVAGSSGTPGWATASGTASTGFDVGFIVAGPVKLRLDMSSTPGDSASEYRFNLSTRAGTVIWDKTAIYDPFAGQQNDYSTLLELAPGEYSVSTYLAAYAWFDGYSGYSGQARATFALMPLVEVPEPHLTALLVFGLTGFTFIARRGRSMPYTYGPPVSRMPRRPRRTFP